jgi:hypothetical protein
MRADGDLFITLVHGTWPRGKWRDVLLTPFYEKWPSRFLPKWLWFADGSEFRSRLTAALSKRGLSAQIAPFLWSGANSVRERDKAARELLEHIRAKQSDYPSCTQVVIAHSHGGNVALRALDKLGVTRDEIFIATIATPFVEIFRTEPSPVETKRIEQMFLASGALLSALIPIVFGVDLWSLEYIVTPVLLLLLWFLLRGLRARDTAKVDELVELTSLSPSVRKHPLLVLRALDDEASLVLAAAAIGNRLSRLLTRWSYVAWISLLVLPVLGLVLLVVLAIIRLSQFGALLLDFMARYLSGMVGWFSLKRFATLQIVAWLAFFASLFVPGLFKSAYGRELLLITQGCEINSQSAPDSIDRQSEFQSESTPTNWGTVVTLHQDEDVRRGLRHGLYADPQCAERIAGWLQSELASRAT